MSLLAPDATPADDAEQWWSFDDAKEWWSFDDAKERWPFASKRA